MLNKILIIGHVGADPVVRRAPSGSPVSSFSVATNRTYITADGEREQETEWFRVVAWERLAEICGQYVNKGRKLFVEGRLRSRTWVGRDGRTRLTNEILAFQVILLDRSRGEEPSKTQRRRAQQYGREDKVSDFADLGRYYDEFDPNEYSVYDFADVDTSVDYGYLNDAYMEGKHDKTWQGFTPFHT